MYKYFYFIVIFYCNLCVAQEADKFIDNPLKHLAEMSINAGITEKTEIMFFQIDMNNDGLLDVFVSATNFDNGQMGYMYSLYICLPDGRYLLKPENIVTFRYILIMINQGEWKTNGPMIVFFRSAVWAFYCDSSNILKSFKIMDNSRINQMANDEAGGVFCSTLAGTRKDHPEEVFLIKDVPSDWKKYLELRKNQKENPEKVKKKAQSNNEEPEEIIPIIPILISE